MPLSPACMVGGKEKALETKPFDWVEHFRPIRHGGLRVFLWTMVFFLEGVIGLECIKFENFPWGEAPAVQILVGLALIHLGLRVLQIVGFLLCVMANDEEHFTWWWKYLCNNVSSQRLHFYCNNKGLIRLSWRATSVILREEKSDLTENESDKNIQFYLRLGGWFFRRKAFPVGGCRQTAPFIDVSPLLKKDLRHVKVSFFIDSSVIAFGSLENAVDYLLMDYGPLAQTLQKLTADSEKIPALKSAAYLAGTLEYTMADMLAMIQDSLKKNPRLGEHRAANELLVKLLGQLYWGFRKAQEKLEGNPSAELNGFSLSQVMPWLDRTQGQIHQLEQTLAAATARNAPQKPNSDQPAPPPQSPKDDSPAE